MEKDVEVVKQREDSNLTLHAIVFQNFSVDLSGSWTLFPVGVKHPWDEVLQVGWVRIIQRGLSHLPIANLRNIGEEVATVAIEGDHDAKTPDVTCEGELLVVFENLKKFNRKNPTKWKNTNYIKKTGIISVLLEVQSMNKYTNILESNKLGVVLIWDEQIQKQILKHVLETPKAIFYCVP